MIRGVRGAITVEEDIEEHITLATEKLLLEMIHANNIIASDVASVLISVTNDIQASFPAKALRNINGWAFVPVMCMTEIPVPNSLPKCIRILMTVNTTIPQEQIKHIYLENAIHLRPDLIKE